MPGVVGWGIERGFGECRVAKAQKEARKLVKDLHCINHI